MLSGCRRVCATWCTIGLLTLLAGLASGHAELTRIGTLTFVVFGAVYLAAASDDPTSFAWRAAARVAGAAAPPPAAAPWQRATPYALALAIGFVVLVGRVLLRTARGDFWLLGVSTVTVAVAAALVALGLVLTEPARTGGHPRTR